MDITYCVPKDIKDCNKTLKYRMLNKIIYAEREIYMKKSEFIKVIQKPDNCYKCKYYSICTTIIRISTMDIFCTIKNCPDNNYKGE